MNNNNGNNTSTKSVKFNKVLLNTLVLNEENLIEKSKQGDRKAINKLMNNYQSRIYSFISAKGIKSHHDVEDLVQETFIQIFRSISSFEQRSKFSSWVLGIALNIVRNHCNRSAQYKYDFVDSSETVLPDSTASNEPHRAVESAAMYKSVNSHIQKLPAHLSDCMRSICIEGHSYNATADEFNISVSSLKSRLFRARKELKNSMLLTKPVPQQSRLHH